MAEPEHVDPRHRGDRLDVLEASAVSIMAMTSVRAWIMRIFSMTSPALVVVVGEAERRAAPALAITRARDDETRLPASSTSGTMTPSAPQSRARAMKSARARHADERHDAPSARHRENWA